MQVKVDVIELRGSQSLFISFPEMMSFLIIFGQEGAITLLQRGY
jgi:hypothetical protein